jgi:hypothetical protein
MSFNYFASLNFFSFISLNISFWISVFCCYSSISGVMQIFNKVQSNALVAATFSSPERVVVPISEAIEAIVGA